MIIDCHGHYTTAPAELEAWRKRQIAAIDAPSNAPRRDELVIGDDAIRASLEGAQLKMQRERGTDLTIFSPRASFMAHHVGNEATSREFFLFHFLLKIPRTGFPTSVTKGSLFFLA